MPSFVLHVGCVLLVLADIAARTWKIAIVFDAMCAPIPLGDSLALTMFGDAAAALTPWRLGGEPARVIGAMHGGSKTATAIVAMGVDNVTGYVVLAAVGLMLGAIFGSEWAGVVRAGPHLIGAREAIVVAILVVILVFGVASRLPRHIVARVLGSIRQTLAQLRAAPPRALVAISALATISIICRIAVLPLVAMALHADAPLGAITLASFVLTNGQMLVPTPSGAGAVELAAAAGVMGTREHTAAVLGTWRVYLTVLPIILGLTASAVRFGPRASFALFRRQ